MITFRDISVLFNSKFNLKTDDRKMIRFLDAENFKIITHGDY